MGAPTRNRLAFFRFIVWSMVCKLRLMADVGPVKDGGGWRRRDDRVEQHRRPCEVDEQRDAGLDRRNESELRLSELKLCEFDTFSEFLNTENAQEHTTSTLFASRRIGQRASCASYRTRLMVRYFPSFFDLFSIFVQFHRYFSAGSVLERTSSSFMTSCFLR